MSTEVEVVTEGSEVITSGGGGLRLDFFPQLPSFYFLRLDFLLYTDIPAILNCI